VIINSGTVGIHTNVQVKDVTFTAGTISGSAVLTVTGQMNWSGGTISGLSELLLSGFLTTSGSSSKTMDGFTLTNHGTITITGSGSILLAGNADLSNQVGATIDIQSDGGITFYNPDGGTLSNYGTLTKSGGVSYSTVNVPLTNTGAVNINSGILRLRNDSEINNSTVGFSGGGVLEFYTDTHILDEVIFSGNGTVRIFLASIEVTGNGISIDSPAILTMTGISSTISGSGAVSVNGTFIWNRGAISGNGPFILNDSCVIGNNTSKTLDGRTLTNNGTITYNGTGTIYLKNNARLVNQSTGKISWEADGLIDFSTNGGVLNNAGIVTKQAGSGTMTIDVGFNNTGILEAKTGTLSFTRALLNDTSGTIRGSSTIDISAATFTNYGSFTPGTSPGFLVVNGNYSQTDTASLNIELGGTVAGTQYDRLMVFGNSQLNGTLNISFINGFFPQIGDQFEVLFFTGRSGEFSSMNYPDPGIGKDFDTTYTPNNLLLNVIATGTRANIKVWLEGPYHAGGYMVTVLNDYVLLPLEQPYNSAPWNYSGTESTSDNTDTTAASTVATRAGWIHADGPVVDMDGVTPLTFDVPNGNYYVVVHHRNHLSIMSASALSLGKTSPLYDFTAALSRAYGNNPMKQLETGVYGMIAGDGNADGRVDISDRESVWRLQNGTTWRYSKLADFNMDGGIDAHDLNNIWRNNEGSLTSVPAVLPGSKLQGKKTARWKSTSPQTF
jgi:phage baseplate assembly protein gpV